MTDFLLVFGSFLLSTFLMGRVIAWCSRKGLIAKVTGRSAHRQDTPIGAGIIIAVATLVTGLVQLAIWHHGGGEMLWFYAALLGGAGLMAVTGYFDDKNSLSPWTKIALQTFAVVPALYLMPQVFDSLPLVVDKAIFFVLWMWFINLYNFMDGIDGLAGAEAVFLGAALSLLVPVFKPLALVIAGSSLGFLRVNVSVKRPAKAFMGDTGSLFLGYIIAGMIFYAASLHWVMLFTLLTLTLVFTGDATFTLVKRMCKGKAPWTAHSEHFYQRAVHKVGMSHTDVVVKATTVNLILLVLVLFSLVAGIGPWVFLLGLFVVAYPAYKIKSLEG